MALSVFRQQLLELLIAEEGGKCRYCLKAVQINFGDENNDRDATVDHIIPRAKKGTNDRKNLALACRRCNHAKGDRDLAAFLSDPYPASKRKTKIVAKRRRYVKFIPGSNDKRPRVGNGTLAAAIERGDVLPHGAYRKPKPANFGSPASAGKIPMSAIETARWLRESAERKGKPWPLA